MALLKKYLLVFPLPAVLMLLGSCEFHPGLKNIGYAKCSRDSDCPWKGLVCLEGICIADCAGADPVVWIGPGVDLGEYLCSDEADCIRPDRLEVRLPPGNFIELAPTAEQNQEDPGCDLLLAWFTLIPMGGMKSATLSVMILGQDEQGQQVMGVESDVELGQEHLDRLYVINPETFAWPVRLRLASVQSGSDAHFELEEYRLLCCDQDL